MIDVVAFNAEVLRRLAQRDIPRRRFVWIVLATIPTVSQRWGVSFPDSKVRKELFRRSKIEGMRKEISRILIPKERTTVISNGVRVNRDAKMFPGYVILRVAYTDRMFHLIHATKGVLGILPLWDKETRAKDNWQPHTLPSEESALLILRDMQRKAIKEKQAMPFKEGDVIRITKGTFEGFESEVYRTDEQSGKVWVRAPILGQTVEVELTLDYLEKV